MIREEILPHSGALPKDFMARVMALLNRGSIHSAADATFSGMCHVAILFNPVNLRSRCEFSFVAAIHFLQK